MHRLTPLAAAALAVLLATACRDSVAPRPAATTRGLAVAPTGPLLATTSSDVPPNGKGLDVRDDPAPPSRTRYRIAYHGDRPVLTGTTNVYLIWYGDWSADPAAPDSEQVILRDLVAHLGGSPYYSAVKLYPNVAGYRPDGNVVLAGQAFDAYSRGTILTDQDVHDLVRSHIAAVGEVPPPNDFPPDAGGVFVVIASADVWTSSGLDSTYCAFHGYQPPVSSGPPPEPQIRYAFVGAASRAPGKCAPQSVGPNGTLDADAAASMLAAVIVDVVTDPDLDAWYDHLGLEAAEKCVWTFGPTYRTSNGALANVRLGARDYLLQQLWVPGKNGGACALHP